MIKNSGKSLRVSAVIAAGGASRRMGFDKLMALLNGEPVIVSTVRAFEICEMIDEIVVVCPCERVEDFKGVLEKQGFKKLKNIVSGGAARQQSVFSGVAATSDDTDIVCIHDGARPLVSQAVIADSISASLKSGAATAAVAVKDTIKRARENIIAETLPRDELFQIQTPQVFSKKLYQKAYVAAEKEYSDDCQLFEKIGIEVALAKGDYKNIKLTTAEDFIVAEAFCAKGE